MEELQKQNESLNQELQSAKAEIKQLNDLRSKIISELGVGKENENIFEGINNLKKTITEKTTQITQLTQDLNKANTEISKLTKLEKVLADIKTSAEKFKTEPWGNENLAIIAPTLIPPNELEFEPLSLEKQFSDQNYWLLKGDLNKFVEELKVQSVFSVMGSYQIGKTFLLSKLANLSFGFGKKFPTLGLNLKKVQIHEINLLSIDTPGLNKPIQFDKLDFVTKTLEDALISNLAAELSNIIIYVVNNLTVQDQKVLESFKKKPEYKKKKFIIVHNFKEVYDENELNEAWRRQVVELYGPSFINYFQVKKVAITVSNQTVYKTIPIFCPDSSFRHVSLVNNNYKFGKEYNEFAFEYIRNVLVYEMVGKKIFDFKESLTGIMEKLLGTTGEILKITKEDDETPDLFKLSFDDRVFFEQIKFRNRNWVQSVRVAKNVVNMFLNEDELVVRIDMPGVSAENVYIECSNKITKVKASRDVGKIGILKNNQIPSKGYEFDIKIPRQFNHINPRASIAEGSLYIVYSLQKINQIKVNHAREVYLGDEESQRIGNKTNKPE